jgi:predicted nucleic acid-binding protein
MAAVVLDTSVLIDLLRRRPGAIERLRGLQQAGDSPHLSVISVEELTRGLLPHEDDDAIALFDAMQEAPIGIPEGRLSGFWRRSFARRGRTLAQSDCLIAAAAAGMNARLATGNPKDFPMRGLVVEHWPSGQ